MGNHSALLGFKKEVIIKNNKINIKEKDFTELMRSWDFAAMDARSIFHTAMFSNDDIITNCYFTDGDYDVPGYIATTKSCYTNLAKFIKSKANPFKDLKDYNPAIKQFLKTIKKFSSYKYLFWIDHVIAPQRNLSDKGTLLILNKVMNFYSDIRNGKKLNTQDAKLALYRSQFKLDNNKIIFKDDSDNYSDRIDAYFGNV